MASASVSHSFAMVAGCAMGLRKTKIAYVIS